MPNTKAISEMSKVDQKYRDLLSQDFATLFSCYISSQVKKITLKHFSHIWFQPNILNVSYVFRGWQK